LSGRKSILPGRLSADGGLEAKSKVEYEFVIDDRLHKISFDKKENVFVISDGEKTIEANIQFISSNALSILIEGRSHLVYLAREGDRKYLSLQGQPFTVQEPSAEGKSFVDKEEKSQQDELLVRAPMPGKVIKINVSEKEEVRKNQTLAIVEAMKMENEIKSTIEGYVKKIFVSAGDLVDSENPLIELGTKD
jgi:biotin carboxyl carrier protein